MEVTAPRITSVKKGMIFWFYIWMSNARIYICAYNKFMAFCAKNIPTNPKIRNKKLKYFIFRYVYLGPSRNLGI